MSSTCQATFTKIPFDVVKTMSTSISGTLTVGNVSFNATMSISNATITITTEAKSGLSAQRYTATFTAGGLTLARFDIDLSGTGIDSTKTVQLRITFNLQ